MKLGALLNLQFAMIVGALLLVIGCENQQSVPISPEIGQMAPVLNAIELTNGESISLESLKGRIVVVEFWASWCGPCQEPMEALQSYGERHPEWADKVVFLAVSIDDSKTAAEKHLRRKGWNGTRNAWIDPEGGTNTAVLAYAGKGIPAIYVVDTNGILTAMGHPNQMDVEAEVASLLESTP